MTVKLGATFKDPGAYATDAVDGLLTTTAVITLAGNVATKVYTTALSAYGVPYVITYNVTDSCCNVATPVLRTVYVVTPCVAPETLCTGTSESALPSPLLAHCLSDSITAQDTKWAFHMLGNSTSSCTF